MSKTIVQHFIEEGEARGRQLMLLNLLQAKFGALPATVEERLQSRSMAELRFIAFARFD